MRVLRTSLDMAVGAQKSSRRRLGPLVHARFVGSTLPSAAAVREGRATDARRYCDAVERLGRQALGHLGLLAEHAG